MTKRHLVLLWILICNSTCAVAQISENIIAKAYYTLKHKRDTSRLDSVYIENMVLNIGTNSSVFFSMDQTLQKQKIQTDIDRQTREWIGPGLPKFKETKGLRKTTNQEIYLLTTEKKIVTKEYLMNNYLYEEPLDEIKWELLSERKIFDKISTQKATANFKGRNWIVWFAEEIPFETGPWKLNGLPGLIIDAHDNKNEIHFSFNGFETQDDLTKNGLNKVGDRNDLIEIPKKVIKLSLSEINKLKDTMYNNSRAFFEAQINANKGLLDSEQFSGLSFKKINNPIELPVNK